MSDVEYEDDEAAPTAEWWVDFGDAPVAVEDLVSVVQAWADSFPVPVERFVLGWPEME